MATRTVETGFFGAAGHGNPEFALTEKTLGASWDFAKTNVPENKTIPILQLPKGFLIDRISLVQTKATDQDVTLTFGLKSDNSFTVGGNFALKDLTGETALCRSSQAPASVTAKDTAGTGTVTVGDSLLVNGDDVLCMIVPDGLTNDKLAAGAFTLFVHGFSAFCEGPTENKTGNAVYRQSLQTVDNVAGERPSFD
jgi:hypothetical protein